MFSLFSKLFNIKMTGICITKNFIFFFNNIAKWKKRGIILSFGGNMKKNIFLVFFGILFITRAFSLQKSIKGPFEKGVNFSSWLEFKSADRIDPNYITKSDFENVKALGCDVVRLPIHFETMSSGAPNYKIDPLLWETLDDVVKWAEELELYVIFDFHNNTANGTSTSKNIEKVVTAVWKQVSERYATSSKYICYEIYNEPHGIDKIKWGKVQEKVIAEIRKQDTSHWIIVGGAEWNSFDALKSLPNYKDDKIIYTFHFYDPFLFTHQGASWTDLGRITGIPFPYQKEKMPSLPQKATDAEKWYLSDTGYNYRQKGSVEAVSSFFDQYVKFSLQRNAPVYCGEFGVYMPYANKDERTHWYKIVTDLLTEREIPHTSWDYFGSFGIFNREDGGLFPQDLNKELVKAMGLTIPEGHEMSWFENAAAGKDYTIYKNGFAKNLRTYFWGGEILLRKKENDERVIEIDEMNPWSAITIQFNEILDFSALLESGAKLELKIKSEEKNLKFSIWLQDAAVKTQYEWRASKDITAESVPCDDNYHTITIPLKELGDIGAYDGKSSKWISSQKAFDWTDISSLVISNSDKKLQKKVYIKDIAIIP